MSWSWIALGALVLVFVLIGIFWKQPVVQKYWKCSLVLLPLLILVILKIIVDIKDKGRTTADGKKSDELARKISDVKDDMTEIIDVAAVETAVARTKDTAKKQQLEEIKAIPDKTERRKRLAALIG